MKVSLVVAWYDWWIGGYYDQKKQRLYLMVPFVGICIDLSDGEEAG